MRIINDIRNTSVENLSFHFNANLTYSGHKATLELVIALAVGAA
jgi:hypothetical protein